MKVSSSNIDSSLVNQANNSRKNKRIDNVAQTKNGSTTKIEEPRAVDTTTTKIDTLNISVKTANSTIGALDVLLKKIQELRSQNKDFEKITLKIQNTQDETQSKSLTLQAQEIKEKMKNTYDSALFQDENVFGKNYTAIIPGAKLDGKKITPDSLDIQKPEKSKEYASNLATQKDYAKDAKRMLQSKIDEDLNAVSPMDSRFERLDTSRLNAQEFKAAHSGKNITLDRVMNLLG